MHTLVWGSKASWVAENNPMDQGADHPMGLNLILSCKLSPIPMLAPSHLINLVPTTQESGYPLLLTPLAPPEGSTFWGPPEEYTATSGAVRTTMFFMKIVINLDVQLP